MSAVPQSLTPATTDTQAMLQAVCSITNGALPGMVDDIDRRGVYPLAILKSLGEAGAFRAHLAMAGEADYGAAIRAIAEVSRVCGATGFMMWCHDVCGLYMEQSRNPALEGAALGRHGDAVTLGATALSNPMKVFAGIEKMLLRARAVEGGYRVSGTLPWVSNLGVDHYFGAIAAVETEDRIPHEIMFMVRCDAEGVTLRECPSFAAMEGTGTWRVRLVDYFVGAHDMIADPARPFIGRIRAAFVLLQCGMGLGVAQGAIDTMRAVEQQLGHVNEYLDEQPAQMQADLDALTARTMALARTPLRDDTAFVIAVLEARAQASEIALQCAQAALLHQGARGYLMSSPVQRRVRESHFVAIVTPALKHLRKEIARLGGTLTAS